MPPCHVLPQSYTWCLRLCSTGTQMTSPPFCSSSTLWQSVAESYGSALRMASGPFLAGIGSPSFHPTSIWRLIKQTNGPSILTRQISHQRSTAGFRQPWRISQAGVSGQEFNRPSIDRFHTAPPRGLWSEVVRETRGVDRVEGKDDKLEQQEGNCWKNVQVGKARSRGPGTEKGWSAQQCARPGEGHNQHQPLGGETTALLTMTLTRADASLCRKERGGCVV